MTTDSKNIVNLDLIKDESDPEIQDMAKKQLEESRILIPKLEDELKILLIPKDPDDSKNVVVEIRAGTGGDEASIFAGDLFRMYTKFITDSHRAAALPHQYKYYRSTGT